MEKDARRAQDRTEAAGWLLQRYPARGRDVFAAIAAAERGEAAQVGAHRVTRDGAPGRGFLISPVRDRPLVPAARPAPPAAAVAAARGCGPYRFVGGVRPGP